MTKDQVRVGARVRDRGTTRTGTVSSISCLALDLVSVQLDPHGYDCSQVWIEIEDLERIDEVQR
jgi:hypothetical protein